MSDFPAVQDANEVVISPFHPGGITGVQFSSATPFAWPASNRALFVPFLVYAPYIAAKIAVVNGGTVSGNIDVGIYSDQGARLVSSGSTAHAGTSALQTFDVTDTTLLPGLYYAAAALDNGTGTVRGWSYSSAANVRPLGIVQMASAFVLPSSATFAVAAAATFPWIGVYGRTLV